MILTPGGNRPRIDPDTWIHESAHLIGDVEISAWSVVGPGTRIPSEMLALGSPARPVRELRDAERAHLRRSAANYARYAKEYREHDL